MMSQTQEQMGTQFSLHKISYDPEGYKDWDKNKTDSMARIYMDILIPTKGAEK